MEIFYYAVAYLFIPNIIGLNIDSHTFKKYLS